jgi:ATP-dependent DNA helicase RecQ
LRVDTFSTEEEKRDAVLRRVEFAGKRGVIYAATHKNADLIATELQDRGVEAVFYHGGLKAKERDDIQDRFMSGDAPVIVATNAFGMGVDKADIRFVYHADISDSLNAYHHEIGRAGRDNKPAKAVLFYCSRDISAQRYKTGSGRIDENSMQSVVKVLADEQGPRSREDLARETGLSTRKLSNLIHKLEEVGSAKQTLSGEIEMAREQSASQITEAAAQQQQFEKDLRKRRLQQMQEYAECRTCRREYLLRYFGDDYTGLCGNCDRCNDV